MRGGQKSTSARLRPGIIFHLMWTGAMFILSPFFFLSKRYPHIYFLFIHPGTNIACAFLPDSTSMQQIIVPYTPRLDLNREREQVGTNRHYSWYIFRPPSKQGLKRSGDSAWGSLSAGLNSSLLGHKAGWQCHALLSFAFIVIFRPVSNDPQKNLAMSLFLCPQCHS